MADLDVERQKEGGGLRQKTSNIDDRNRNLPLKFEFEPRLEG